jgi:hypothetical protein
MTYGTRRTAVEPLVDIQWRKGQGKVPFCAVNGDMLTFIGYGGKISPHDRVYADREGGYSDPNYRQLREARNQLDLIDTIVWKDNYAFDAKLSFIRLWTGRSAARAEFMCQELDSKGDFRGDPYAVSMQQDGLQWLLKNQTPEMEKGFVVRARCTFTKKGQNYALAVDTH